MNEASDEGRPLDQAFLDRVRLSQAEFEAVVASGVFDREFYLTNNPDLRGAGVDPLDHYLVTGRYEKRRPSAFFDPVEYLEVNPDLQVDMEPFQHYALIGKKAGLAGSRAEVICRILSEDFSTRSQADDVSAGV